MNSLIQTARRKALLIWILAMTSFVCQAQFVIQYPSSSQGITVCLNSSLLTVRIDVSAIQTSNDSVFVKFPPGITYIPGTITKIGGTAELGISEAGGTPEAPKFVISPVTISAGQNITFTLQRQATCSASIYALEGGIFKDAVKVKGTMGYTEDSDPAINPYNINSPSISIAQPAVVNNTVPGAVYTRNFTITNGADGCVDKVHFYIIYPNSGLELLSLSLAGNPIKPTSIKGDTLFYTINGLNLTVDGSLCNGENLVFTETFKVKQYNTAPTVYMTGWGNSNLPDEWCQTSRGQGSISYADGVPKYSKIARENLGFIDKCTPFDYSLTLTNGGSGNVNAATMYDIAILQGQNGRSPFLTAMDMTLYTLSNVRVGILSVPFTISNGIMTINLKNLFTSDPDGVGGLTDMDGDGYYDDLPNIQSIKYTVTLKFNCVVACNTKKILSGLSATLRYHTMSDTVLITADRLNANMPLLGSLEIDEEQFLGTAYLPANIKNDVPFRLNLRADYLVNSSYYDGINTRYRWKVVLPPGVTVSSSGNPTYGDVPVTFTKGGDTIIYTSSNNSFNTFNIDLVYNCMSGGGVKNFEYKLEKIQDITTPCKCQGDLVCANIATMAFCPTQYVSGPTTYIPIVKRTNGSLGWTDATLAVRQNSAAISAYDLSKALYLDTIQILGSARQNNVATNLHLEFKLAKTTLSPTGLNKLTPLSITINIYRGGILLSNGSLNSASQASSTSSQQQIDWDLTSFLPTGGLLPRDSIYSVSKYWVSTNNGLPQNDIQSGKSWTFYNLKNTLTRDEFNFVVPEMYLVGTTLENRINLFETTGCNAFQLGGGNSYYLARRFNTSGSLFQNEYRPVIFIDSVVLDIPEGYEFISAKFRAAQNSGSILMNPTSISGHIYTFVNPGTWENLPITVANDYGGFVTVEVRPSCTTQPVENVNIKTYIKDFYYAYAGRTAPSGMSVILEGPTGKTDSIVYSTVSAPEIMISDQTGLIQAGAPTESCIVRLSSVGTSTIPFTWLGIPKKAGVKVIQVKDMATNTVLTPITYSEGNWYKLSTSGIPSGTKADYRIYFSYTSSTKDSLKVMAGWNCSSFPTNPTSYTCGADSLWLKFEPVISEVGIIPISAPEGSIDLCVPAIYKYSINCSQSGNTINNTFSIKFPSGLFQIAGSFEAEYPLGANNWTTMTPVISGNTFTYNLTEHPAYPITTGLPGTLNATTVNDRQIGVRFKTITNCDFVVNTNFILSTSANRPSGILAIGSSKSLQGPNIAITGVSMPYTTVNTLSSSNLVSCSNTAKISVKSIVVAGKTGASGSFKIELPTGIQLVPSSFTCSTAPCPTFISSTMQPNNKILLQYAIPSGIDAGIAMQFSFDVRDDNSATCDLNTIDLRTEEVVTSISCPTESGGVCKSLGVVTGTGNTTLSIIRPRFSFTSLTGNVASIPNNISEIYDINLKVSNSGSANLSDSTPLIVDFYCADGLGNPTGNVLATFNKAVAILIGETIIADFTFIAKGCTPSGDLVAIISKSSNCICTQVIHGFHANVIPIANQDNNSTLEDKPVSFCITCNDTDIDGTIAPNSVDLDPAKVGKQTTFTVLDEGIYTIDPYGVVTFSPILNFNGTTTPVNYTVQDNFGTTSNSALIIITVNAVNYIPQAKNDAQSILEDTPENGNVSTNDIPSADGGNIWSLVGENGGAANGPVIMINDGKYSYTPDINFFGVDIFTYKVCDVDGDCSTATVTVTVNPVNDPPVAVADNYETKENQKLEDNILVNDYDTDRDLLVLDIAPVQATTHGKLVLLPNGDFSYQPLLDFVGIDSFTYRLCDNGTPSLCSSAIVKILVLKNEGCEVTVPNSFSPNDDGIHDNLKIRCLYNYENPIIEIYNRWGNLVFKKEHYGDTDYWGSESDAWWAGRSDSKLTIGNEQLSVGTYYYVLKLNKTKVLTGFLFLNK